jgi:hypothetical protein
MDPVTVGVLGCLLLAGCGAARQSAADALAGLDAIRSQVDADPSMDLIFAGVADHVLATVGAESRADLPAPRLTPVAILADPPAYAAQAAEDKRQAAGAWWRTALSVSGAVGLSLLLLVAKRYPILEPIAALLTSRRTIQQRAEVSTVADEAVAFGESMKTLALHGGRADVTRQALDDARKRQIGRNVRDRINAIRMQQAMKGLS